MNIPAVWIAYERKRIVNGESQTERGWVNEAGLCTPMSVSDGNEKSFQDLCWTSEARLAKTPTASTPKPAYIFPLGPQSKVEWAVEILMSVTALTPSWGWEEEAISWVWNTAFQNDVWHPDAVIRYRCRLEGFSLHDLLDISKVMRSKQRNCDPSLLEFDRYDLMLRSQQGNELLLKDLDIPFDLPGFALRSLASRLFNETEGNGFPADDLPFDEGRHTWIHRYAFTLKAAY